MGIGFGALTSNPTAQGMQQPSYAPPQPAHHDALRSNYGAELDSPRKPYQRAILTREDLEQALAATNGHQTLAARALGVTLRQLRYRIQQLEMEPRDFRK